MASSAEVLQTPLQYLKGVGPRRAADFRRAGLHTVEDLLYRFPLRYEDRSRFQSIASLREGQRASIMGEVVQCSLRPTRRPRLRIFEALIRDKSGSLRVAWFNSPYLQDQIRPRDLLVLYGLLERNPFGGLQFTNPDFEILDDEDHETLHTGRIVPIYERARSITPKMQRRLVLEALNRLPGDLEDPLPESVRRRLQLPGRVEALRAAHFPETGTSLDALNAFRTPAQQRMIVEEFFRFQVGLLLRKRASDADRKPFVTRVDDRTREALRSVLPFRLTPGQRQALKEIGEDMQRPRPMNRLLQGDVGAGKTIVAVLAAVLAMENGQQVAFMAPTEILAEQHFNTITRLLSGRRYRVGLLTGHQSASERRAIRKALAAGEIDLVVGTHALVQKAIQFRTLGLVVIDEQHRFGVMQRATLREKGLNPDMLVMTATPIPRTLALTTYGDLDVSSIRDLPPGRVPVRTIAKPESRRTDVYEFLRRELEQGRQAYVVYPIIEESEKTDLRAATEMADHLAHDVFPEFRVALLHGRMRQDAKDRVMRAFAAGDIHVLVSTTVIEVGIDVPNATMMLVEHAERFGLSQLHQLRGRIGRGSHASACILLYQYPLTDDARERLEVMTKTSDGFEIAEKDLELRGPGDLFGTRQAGAPTLRAGNLLRDHALMEIARREAATWLDTEGASSATLAELQRTWAERFGLIAVG
ncbi:MAG TPA: ATP-dependent DNA helicase RecG [Vicinamibacterales bacterium]|nr:ATP-dependent DNA helicase RecG [Vicinamibacterales bacterium]